MTEEKKYAEMPEHLSERVFKGVAFIYAQHIKDPQSSTLPEDVRVRLEFLEKDQGYTRREIRYILLLLALPEVDEVLRKSEILEKAFAEFTIKRYNIH